jgi:TonB-dependent starch-binding outer membrane protein SusC
MQNKKFTLPLTLMRLAKNVSVAILFLQQLQFGAVAFGQTLSVNGNILNDKGTPVEGASIVQKGPINGTVSDKAGVFSMQVSSNTALEISAVGYCKKEVNVIGSVDNTIEILFDDKILGEIVGTVYVTQKNLADLNWQI